MSSFLDERIVEMSFDNKNFEKNVKTSMNTIDQLKSSLNFSGVSSSMQNTFNSLDASGITASLSKAAEGFSTLEIMGISAISNITNKVIDLGLQMIKSLSVDNIASGWAKYGEKTTSVATLVAQGYEMENVNEQLEKLLWYTDETSYTFTDMVSNISKFTAAGQGLEESVQAMMGIANWAALSGQNASTASRSMYQLSQAMGSGVIRLMDWRSIQNANMDTQEFRKTVLDTALAMGTLTQSIDGSYTTETGKIFDQAGFTTELAEGWFTSDVLMKSLQKYSSAVDTLFEKVSSDESISTTSEAIDKYGDELDEFGLKAFKAAQEAKTLRDTLDSVKEAVGSAWLTTFENIFGSYDKAKVLWTNLANELYDVFVEGSNVRNEILKKWADMGGQSDLFVNTEDETGAFWNLFYAIVEVKNLISSAWNTIFPLSEMEDESDRINDISNKLKKLTEWLKAVSEGFYMSEETAGTFTNILRGAFSFLKAFLKIIGALWTGIQPVLNALKSLFSSLFNFMGGAGDSFANFVDTTDKFQVAGEKLAEILTVIIDEIKSFEIIKNIVKMVNTLRDSFKKNGGTSENFSRILKGLKTIIDVLITAFKALYSFIKTYIIPILGSLLTFSAKILGAFGGKIVSAFAWISDLIVKFVNFIRTSEKLNKVFDKIKSGFSNLMKSMKEFFEGFKKVDTSGVDNFNEDVTKKFNPLTSLLKGLATLFSGLWSVLKALLPVLSKTIEFVGNILKGFGEKLSSVFGKDGGVGLSEILSMGFLIFVSKAIIDAADVFKSVFSSINEALISVVGGFSDVLHSKAMMNYAEALKTFAIGILILVAALILLSTIDDDQLKRSLTILIVLMGALAVMMLVMKKMTETTKFLGVQSVVTAYAMKTATAAMMRIAISVAILALALKLLSTIEEDKLMNGLMGLIMITALLLGASAIIGKNEKIFKKGARGLISMAIAVILLSIPLKKIGSMDPKQLTQGLLGISALVALCVLFAKISGSVKKAVTTAMGMILFAGALLLISIPFKIIGNMSWPQIAKGFVGILGIAGIMVMLGLLSKYMEKAIITGIAMFIVASSLILVASALLIFSSVKWTSILKAIVSLAAIFGALAILTKVLNFKMIAGLLLLGIALIPLSIGLTTLALSLKALGAVEWKDVWKALGIIVLILGLGGIIMGLIGFLGPSIIMFSISLLILSTALVTLAVALAALGALSWKTLGKGLLVLVVALAALAAMGVFLKPFSGTILKVAVAMLLFAAAILIISVALTLLVVTLGIFGATLVKTLKLIAMAIIEAAPMIALAIGALLSAIFQGLTVAIGELFILLGVLITEILNFLWEHGPRIIETVIMLLTELLVAIAKYFPTMMDAIIGMVITLLLALKENIGTIIDIVIDILLNLIKALTDRVPEIIDALGDMVITIIEALVDKIVELVPRLVTAAFDLVLGLIEGLGQAIEDNAVKVRETMISFCGHMINAFLGFFGMKTSKDKSTTFLGLGKNLIKGLMQGFNSMLKEAVNSVKNLGSKILSGIKGVLGIKSPSKEMAEIGKFVDQGLVTGMNNNSDQVYESAESLGEDVIEGVNDSGITKAIQQLYSTLGNDLDGELVIRPVMDLTDIQNGTNEIFGMMKKTDGYSINGSNDIANKTAYSIRSNGRNDSVGETLVRESNLNKTESPINFYNTFTINDAINPKEVADEVAEIMQAQVSRRKVQYGKSNI